MDFLEFVEQENIFYHVTLADNIPKIAKMGLIPSEETNWGGDLGNTSLGKVYLAKSPQHALYYGLILFRQKLEAQEYSHIPILLRTRQEQVTRDPEDQDSAWVKKTIPPQLIEVKWQDQWIPLSQANQFIGGDLYYQYSAQMGGYVDWEGGFVGETLADAVEDVEKFILGKEFKEWQEVNRS